MKTVTIYYAGFKSRAGGVAYHARNLERELRRIGWSVEIITLDSLPIWFRYLPHFVAKTVNLVYSPFGILYKVVAPDVSGISNLLIEGGEQYGFTG